MLASLSAGATTIHPNPTDFGPVFPPPFSTLKKHVPRDGPQDIPNRCAAPRLGPTASLRPRERRCRRLLPLRPAAQLLDLDLEVGLVVVHGLEEAQAVRVVPVFRRGLAQGLDAAEHVAQGHVAVADEADRVLVEGVDEVREAPRLAGGPGCALPVPWRSVQMCSLSAHYAFRHRHLSDRGSNHDDGVRDSMGGVVKRRVS